MARSRKKTALSGKSGKSPEQRHKRTPKSGPGRANARASLSGQWADRSQISPAIRGTPQAEQLLATKGVVATVGSEEELREVHAFRDFVQGELDRQDENNDAVVTQLLSTEPATKGTRKRIYTRRQNLVSPTGEVDYEALFASFVEIMNLMYEATVGLGAGGLFDHELAALQALGALGTKLRLRRDEIRHRVRTTRLLTELTEIYQRVTDDWPAGETTTGKPRETRVSPEATRIEDRERAELAQFAERHNLPGGAQLAQKYAYHAPYIRQNGYANKVAAAVLDELALGSDSKVTKDRGRISPLFAYRAEQMAFPFDGESSSLSNAAEQLAQFSRQLYEVATETPPVHFGPALDAEARRRGLGDIRHELLLLRRYAALRSTHEAVSSTGKSAEQQDASSVSIVPAESGRDE